MIKSVCLASYREWRRDWPDEARQPLGVLIPERRNVFRDERERVVVRPPSVGAFFMEKEADIYAAMGT